MAGRNITPLPLRDLRVFPLQERKSLSTVDEVLIPPETPPPDLPRDIRERIEDCAGRIREARRHEASVILMYGAHLLRNGAVRILERLMAQGWITHLATNGAGTIHDWEYAWLGRSTESVEENVAAGNFGAWEETGRNIHAALMAGALRPEGYGAALGRFIREDGTRFPSQAELATALAREPAHPLASARADLLQALARGDLPEGPLRVEHAWKEASILGEAFRLGVPVTVHPGIGYDIISNHPMFSGSVIGRAADMDFRLFGGAVERLDRGVVLSVGSAIMAPQVFEKSLSCVHNLRRQAGRPNVSGHSIYVVDLQDGGRWDWTQGEPPKHHPAYYLRFCKSFSRMGGRMHYLCCDNRAFVHHLMHLLSA